MQTNNIGYRNYEVRDNKEQVDTNTRLVKKHHHHNHTSHKEKIDNEVNAILEQISTAISRKLKECPTSNCQNTQNTTKTENSSETQNDDSMLNSITNTNNTNATIDSSREPGSESSATDTTNDPLANSSTTQVATSTPTDVNKSQNTLNSMLSADSSGNVNEEQLQSAIVQHLLEQKNKDLGKTYLQELANSIGKGNQFEDSVKEALKALVKQGVITKDEAEKINGDSFRAAQLDNNLEALYDSKGGKGDDTVAVMKLEDAIKSAMQVLDDIKSGKTTSSIRSLDAPSNKKGNTSSAGSSNSAAGSSGSSNGFLWKPVSDSNGKLVVLFPPNLTGNILSAGIYSKLPASYENLIEEGKFAGDANGDRAHFRFSKPGSSYPDGVFAVAQLKDGSQATFQIGDSASRNT